MLVPAAGQGMLIGSDATPDLAHAVARWRPFGGARRPARMAGCVRALRQVTKGMQKASPLPSLTPMKMFTSSGSFANPGHGAQEGPRPGLLSTFGQSVQMLRALHGTAQTTAQHSVPENASTKAGDMQGSGSSPFAVMLIARRNGNGRPSFKDRT